MVRDVSGPSRTGNFSLDPPQGRIRRGEHDKGTSAVLFDSAQAGSDRRYRCSAEDSGRYKNCLL